MPEFSKPLAMRSTPIDGLLLFDLPVHGDNRGWFKENWQRQKMVAAGLPDFGPVQNNISFNDAVGTTRGIHGEPWDKFISIASGRIFGAWVDLRQGPGFGTVFTAELDPSVAIYVPRGVGNAYQTLEPNTVYTYLVNDHWSADTVDKYTFLNLADETAAIAWPIPLAEAELSEKDRQHPRMAEIKPAPAYRPAVERKRTLVLGANGQVGKALKAAFQTGAASHGHAAIDSTDVDYLTRLDFDIADPESFGAIDWANYQTVINATAYTAVDTAETHQGRTEAWAANVAGVAALVRVCAEHKLTLVHFSSDYVFDGRGLDGNPVGPYAETAPFSPLGVYAQTKAAGDALVGTLPKHYILRTSWLIGEGTNFVRSMAKLAAQAIDPTVVNDQRGRLTFATDLVAAVIHLLGTESATPAAYGTYNLTNSGAATTWFEIAQEVFQATGHNPARVTPATTEEYFAAQKSAGKLIAPRPLNSLLDLTKIEETGFVVRNAATALQEYLKTL